MEKKRKGGALKAILAVILILAVLIGAFVFFNSIYIDFLWYKETGYLSVYLTELVSKAKIGGALFIAFFVIFSVYFKLLTLSGGSTILKTNGGFVRKGLPYLIALVLAGFSAAAITHLMWYDILTFINSVPFGETDPIFNKDISFYMFRLPLYNGLIWAGAYLMALLFLVTIVYSFIVVAGKSSDDRKAAESEQAKGFFSRLWNSYRLQTVLFLTGAFLLAGCFFLTSRYAILFKSGDLLYGATYTDVNITAPVYTIVALFCGICALTTLICGIAKKIKPMIAVYIITAVVFFIGQGAQFVVQRFLVDPNEFTKESLYLSYAIKGTQAAYGLDDINVKTYGVDYDLTAKDIEDNQVTIGNISINDYAPALDTYNSTQSIRTYYEFNDVDIDRYDLQGDYTQVFISARELDTGKLSENAQTWINKYMKYTHGFGFVISPVNTTTNTGQPVLIAYDIPTKTQYKEFNVAQPRIYFGESTDDYAIVNTLSGEFDYPSGSNNVENVYEGTAGIRLSLINRLAFCLKYKTTKFLLSAEITGNSKILINRDFIARVRSIAPFLSYDSDPYLVIADGKLYWMLDAMATSTDYPYSHPYSDDEGNNFNYIRSSVKVVMDAYNGDVTFYIADEKDPLVMVYSGIYPDLFVPLKDMPASLRAHIRYSEAYFNVQAKMYLTYHMSNTSVFYNKEDEWALATQYSANKTKQTVESAYLIMKLPDRDEEFLIMVPFTVVNKDNMVAWMAGICDGDDYGELIVYQFEKNSAVYGPMQIEQRIDQDTTIAPQLALLAQEGSSLLRGNLLTIPIANSILYVEPIYIQASSSSTSIPEMKKVIVSYGDTIIMRDTLSECLDEIFGTKDGKVPMPDDGVGQDVPPDQGNTDDGGNSGEVSGDTASLVKRANELFEAAQKAQSSGDWSAYGKYMDELKAVLSKLAELTGNGTTTADPAGTGTEGTDNTGDTGTPADNTADTPEDAGGEEN